MEWIVLDNALNLGPSICNGKNDATKARLFTPRKQKLARCVEVLQELAVFFNKTAINGRSDFPALRRQQ